MKHQDVRPTGPVIKKYKNGRGFHWAFVGNNFASAPFETKTEGFSLLYLLNLSFGGIEKDVEILLKLLNASKEIPGKMPISKRND